MQKNFYLELLKKHVDELRKVINNEESYDKNIYNCLLAGIVVRMNSILEQGLLDFHSENFNEIASLIYDSRQLLVHCNDYYAFSNIDVISKEIIELFDKSYSSEQEYFDKILTYDYSFEYNVVIEKNRSITYDEQSNSYVFENGKVEIAISSDKIIRIQDLKRLKDVAYIVNCESSMNYLFKSEDGDAIYHELSSVIGLQDFFSRNFRVSAVNYQGHKNCIKDVLDNFYKPGNYCAILTQEKNDDDDAIPLKIETSLLLNRFFNENIVYRQLLDERMYTTKEIPHYNYTDYKKIRMSSKLALENNVSKRDYFFIRRSISMLKGVDNEMAKAKVLSDSERDKLRMTLLINWVNHTITHLSDNFVHVNKEFAQLHHQLLYYRNFFAHDILQVKTTTSKKILDEFYEIAVGYVSVLNSLNIETITNNEGRNLVNFVAIERMPYHFLNHKYKQFVEVDPLTYIGDRLIYSTRGSDCQKIIGLVGIDKDSPFRGAYYENKNGELIAKTVKGKGRAMNKLFVSKVNYSKGKNVSFDVNCNDLLYIYAAYKGKISRKLAKALDNASHKKVIIFNPSNENNFEGHAKYLDDVIANYYQQNYLPFELIKDTKLELAQGNNGKGYFRILDQNDVEIAKVVDCNRVKDYDVKVDDKAYFSLYYTTHDFSKRRT